MRPSAGTLAVLLSALAAAGCLDGGPARDPAAGAGGDCTLTAAASVANGACDYLLDCTIGANAPGWTEPCLALASPNDSPSKTEVDLAVNPLDPLNVVVASKDMDPLASSGPCVWAVAQVTHDGGRSWQTVYVGGTTAERAPAEPLWGWRCITDPILQFAPDGTLHYSLQAYDYDPAGIALPAPGTGGFELEGGFQYTALSRNGGVSFPDIRLMHAGDELAVFHDFMRMGHNPSTGTVVTIWNQLTALAGRVPVVVATQADGTVRPPTYLVVPQSPAGAGINAIVGTPDGRLHAFLTVSADGVETLLHAVSDDDGRSFSPTEPRFGLRTMDHPGNVEYRMGTNVEVAADLSGGPRHGCLVAVWSDAGSDGGDILARSSCDGGVTWSSDDDEAAHLVSSGPRQGVQVFPRVSIDGRGVAHAVYHTQAYDPQHRLVDTEWAYSLDGGATWSVRRLTTLASDGDLGIHQNGGAFFGDYIGIGSSGDHTYMAFPHTLTGRAEIAVAHVVASGDRVA